MKQMRSTDYVYEHGLPFSTKLGENIDDQLERIDFKKASLVIIDGPVGCGKTTLLIHLCDYINKKKDISETSLKLKDHIQIALGGKQFTSYFRQCHERGYQVSGYDEAGDFSRKSTITAFNQMLNRLFETYRGFKVVVIILLPNFNVLDNQLFDNQIPRMLIHITRRRKKQADFSVYSLAQMNWIRYWFDKLPKGAKHKCYSKVVPNFRGHFLNLPPEREKMLDKLSTEGKKGILLVTEIKLDGLVGYSDISRKVLRNPVWVRNIINQMNIKPDRIIKRKKYFKEHVIDILLDHIEKINPVGRPKQGVEEKINLEGVKGEKKEKINKGIRQDK